MILISHRGNLSGLEPGRENTTEFIQEAIDKGYDVEIDVRLLDNGLYLGHDDPDYPVELSWLAARRDFLWIHAKNFPALDFFMGHGLRVFYHQLEKHTVIGNTQFVWSHDLSEASERSIVPMLSLQDVLDNEGNDGFHGVCSDYIEGFLP